MKCENCGNENLEKAKICAFCNEPLKIDPLNSEKINDKIDTILSYSQENEAKVKKDNVNSFDQEDEYEYYDEYEEHVSVGGWMGIICLNLVPILGNIIFFILIIVWAFGGTKKVSLKNFARATLFVGIIVAILLVGLFFALNALGIDVFQIVLETAQSFIK